MPVLNKLNPTKIKTLPAGKYGDGGGLWLQKRDTGLVGNYVYRYQIDGKRKEMGVGSMTDISLKEARERAARARVKAKDGIDPIAEKRAKRANAANPTTLKEVCLLAFEAKKADLKNEGKSARWLSPLEKHVFPKIGDLSITDLDQKIIRATFEPIWHSKAETARKGINRLNTAIEHAVAMDLDVDMQAVGKAKILLGKQKASSNHIPSMPWQDVPKFFKSLKEPTICQLALKLVILTAVRSGEARFIRLDEIENGVWTIPKERMKAGIEHRVPLSKQALNVIEQAKAFERDGFLFPNVRKGVLSDAAMSRLMERRKLEARPHGFRSSFRTWCAEQTDTPREIAEVALAHKAGSKVELAYRRTDYLEIRTELMQTWADFVSTHKPKASKD